MKLYKTESEEGEVKPSESATIARENVPEC